jgi:DNA-directed RNA polymerase subunit L
MKLNIVEDKKDRMVVEIHGETHSFCNALKKELWNDSHVKVSGYRIEHPLVGIPTFIIETDGKESPKKAFQTAVTRLKKEADNFKSAFLKGVK